MNASAPAVQTRDARGTISLILLGGGIIELLLFLWLAGGDVAEFNRVISTPDTPSYIGVAEQLATERRLVHSPRTPGYALFAATAYFVGGQQYAPHLIIGTQLLLNLVLTWLGWRLLERIAPDTGLPVRALATVVLLWAGMGMATFLMTDFLAAFCFGVFVYGTLFWRTRGFMLVAGAALGAATLIRPTFTFVPLLFPAIAYFVRHITTRLPATYVVVFAVFSLSATSLSIAYQYRADKYLGPSPLLTVPIREMIYYGTLSKDARPDFLTFQKQFEQEIEERGGRAYASLTFREREEIAKKVFREQFLADPVGIAAAVLKNGMKYVFAPIESTVSRFATYYVSEAWYARTVRPIVAVICLPLFVLSVLPPIRRQRDERMYYALVLVLLIYVVGLSAIGIGSGERIRFPLLAFMLPILAWNVETLRNHALVLKLRRNAVRRFTDGGKPA